MKAWRLARQRYAALDGAGAALHGGRWNRRKQRVVYTSEHLSLAVLEVIVNLETEAEDFPEDYVKIAIELPDSLPIRRIAELPPGDEAMLKIGSDWLDSGASAALIVPSIVIPEEHNLLLNPAHADFPTIKAAPPRPFRFDRRLAER